MANIDDQLLDILRWPNNKKPVRQSTATQIKLEQIERINKLFHSLLISKLPEKKPLVLEKEYSTPRELLPQEQEIKLNTNHQVIGFNQAVDNMNRVIDEMFGVQK